MTASVPVLSMSEVLYIQMLHEHIFLSVHLKCFCRTVEDVVTYVASGTRICSFFFHFVLHYTIACIIKKCTNC